MVNRSILGKSNVRRRLYRDHRIAQCMCGARPRSNLMVSRPQIRQICSAFPPQPRQLEVFHPKENEESEPVPAAMILRNANLGCSIYPRPAQVTGSGCRVTAATDVA